MILDSNFKVFVLYKNGEKFSVLATRGEVNELIGAGAMEDFKIEVETIRNTRDLETLLEDELTDSEFEAWESRAMRAFG